ncbi:ABC-2 type transport system permease protein [Sphingomonas kaistensis]|uniref:ABC-2 type transport system permease protein n=1 Tax=Sphingomonas kaistensis TaxID=298708 RepID=A0A7X5Y429_9SPHN|nr:ABC transporter permease [Sphingomonas kaistensis]NJC04711.1 ABC-2 type transport system permease protein [Sphingomonas kaistensis]
MTRHLNKLQAAFVIARRDYTATVFSRAFLFFLLGPLFPILLGVLFGGIGAKVASDTERVRVAVIAAPAEFARVERARMELAALPGTGQLPLLKAAPLGTDYKSLLNDTDGSVIAVLEYPFNAPSLIGKVSGSDPIVGQVRLILDRAANGPTPIPEIGVIQLRQTAGATRNAREITARAGQALLFLLTLLLSGMLLSQLIEEKSNKVIEVLAAAVPVESIFIGKLFAMLAMSLTGIAVWMTVAISFLLLFAPGLFAVLPVPAIGWPLFLLLGALYYGMSYLLIGAAFLGIGAQASTAREVQTLSMPVTMGQVGLLLLANFAISDPHGSAGIAAAAFPLSSPFAMMARAALDGAVLPHLAALLWQGLWVALMLKLVAAWFRRSVLNSSGPRPRWWKRVEIPSGLQP